MDTKIDHKLHHKGKVSQTQKIETLQTIFFDHNAIKQKNVIKISIRNIRAKIST